MYEGFIYLPGQRRGIERIFVGSDRVIDGFVVAAGRVSSAATFPGFDRRGESDGDARATSTTDVFALEQKMTVDLVASWSKWARESDLMLLCFRRAMCSKRGAVPLFHLPRLAKSSSCPIISILSRPYEGTMALLLERPKRSTHKVLGQFARLLAHSLAMPSLSLGPHCPLYSSIC